MGRHSCCAKQKLRKGLWCPEEDEKLYNYITRFGVGCWSSVPKLAGLERCGKSCRLRWINYLQPDLKRGMFSQEEEDLIVNSHQQLGNRWAQIAAQLPGRTDNEIKNFWNSAIKKKLMKQGIDPNTHQLLKSQVIKSNKNMNEDEFKNFSEVVARDNSHVTATKTIKTEPPSGLNISSDNCTSVFSSAASSSFNSQAQFSYLEGSDGGVQSYQSLILSECQGQMPALRPTPEGHAEAFILHSSVSEPMLQSLDEFALESANLGETGADYFTESLMFSDGKACSSSSSNNNIKNITSCTSFCWENNSENNIDSEMFLCPFDYGFVKMEVTQDQSSSWEEEQLKSLSLCEDLAAETGGNWDVFLQHL